MKCVAVASFAGGLLLGSCIALVGLRGFLLRQDTLLRQSSLEKLAPSPNAASKPAGRPLRGQWGHNLQDVFLPLLHLIHPVKILVVCESAGSAHA